MRSLLVVLAVIISLPAFGQGLNTLAPGAPPAGKVLAAFPFATSGCFATGTDGVTIARASTATVDTTGTGTLTVCAADEYRVGVAYPDTTTSGPTGLVVEPARTNDLTQSNTISTAAAATAPWALYASAVATVAGAPMGGTWAELSGNDPDAQAYQITGATGANMTVSVWAAKASGTGKASVEVGQATWTPTACTCARSDGGSCTAAIQGERCRITVSDLGTTPVRLSATGTGTSTTAFIVRLFAGARGESAASTTRYSGAQLEVGAFSTSLIPTVAAPVPRAADVVSATVPSVPSKGWCIAGTFRPTFAWPNALSLWTLGANYNDANAASSWGNSSLYIVDAASGVKDLGAFPATPVSPWRIVTCNKSGTLSAYVNDVLVDETATGAGTGILTTPSTTIRLGSQTGGGTISDWYIKNVKVCSGGWKTCK